MRKPFKFKDGSTLEWVDKESLRYTEGNLSALIWVDFKPGFFSRGRVLQASSIDEWEAPTAEGNKIITPEKKEEICNKVVAYYQKLKRPCRVET